MAQAASRPHHRGMTEKKLRELRLSLQANQSALQTLLRKREGIAVERSADPSDEAQSAFCRELTIRSVDRKVSLLAEIRFALRRIEDGTYGACQACDAEIGEKRLAAVPWAEYCIHCQPLMAIPNGRKRKS